MVLDWKHVKLFLLSGSSRFGKNVITFGVDNSSSLHADNRKKDILILSKGPTGGLDDRTLTREVEYSINFINFKSAFQWKQEFFVC